MSHPGAAGAPSGCWRLLVPGAVLLLSIAAARGVPAAPADVPHLVIGDAAVAEGDSDTTSITFPIHLSSPAPGSDTLVCRTADGTATAADFDYVPAVDTLVLAEGTSDTSVSIAVLGDRRLEANERFTVTLDPPGWAQVDRGTAIGTILNDEHTSFVPYPHALLNFGWPTGPAWGDVSGEGRNELFLYTWKDGFLSADLDRFADLGSFEYHGDAWCDYDGDGDLDYIQMPYASNTPTRLHLFRNDGGAMTDIAPAQQMDILGFGETPVWGDFDGDGHPDLFAPFYAHVSPGHSFLFHNNGDGTFTDIADSVGVALRGVPESLKPEGAAAVDLDGDGSLDLYAASHLFINDGSGRFTDEREQRGLPVMFDEGSQFVDYDNDGDFDLYIRAADGPHLFRNDGGQFVEVTAQMGFPTDLGFDWGDRWEDIDNDGDLDLILFGDPYPTRLLINRGDGTFETQMPFGGIEETDDALSAWADIDGDGDLDVAIGVWHEHVFVNQLDLLPGESHSFIEVRVLDALGHETQHGASVRLESLDDPAHPVQSRIVDGGSGYVAQDQYDVHFGGVGSGRYTLKVSFPSTREHPVRVDSLTTPALSELKPSDAGGLIVTVRRDSSCDIRVVPPPALAVLGPLRPAPASLRTYPNPARSSVHFLLDPAPSTGRLEIFDVMGRQVRSLEWGTGSRAGALPVWDLRNGSGQPVASGVYVARFSAPGLTSVTQRVLVLR